MPDASVAALSALYLALGFKIAALILLGFWGTQCFKHLRIALDSQPPGVETSWGGLGGSLGGWSMSKSLAWLLVTVVTLALFASLALQLGEGLSLPAKPDPKPAAGTAVAPSSTTSVPAKTAPATDSKQ